MAKIKIIHDRKKCIGCGSCVAICPNFFILNENDGLANLIEGKEVKGRFEREVNKIDRYFNEVINTCPVGIIKIKK